MPRREYTKILAARKATITTLLDATPRRKHTTKTTTLLEATQLLAATPRREYTTTTTTLLEATEAVIEDVN